MCKHFNIIEFPSNNELQNTQLYTDQSPVFPLLESVTLISVFNAVDAIVLSEKQNIKIKIKLGDK